MCLVIAVVYLWSLCEVLCVNTHNLPFTGNRKEIFNFTYENSNFGNYKFVRTVTLFFFYTTSTLLPLPKSSHSHNNNMSHNRTCSIELAGLEVSSLSSIHRKHLLQHKLGLSRKKIRLVNLMLINAAQQVL